MNDHCAHKEENLSCYHLLLSCYMTTKEPDCSCVAKSRSSIQPLAINLVQLGEWCSSMPLAITVMCSPAILQLTCIWIYDKYCMVNTKNSDYFYKITIAAPIAILVDHDVVAIFKSTSGNIAALRMHGKLNSWVPMK